MRVYAIRDEHDVSAADIAYLIYYEHDKRFYIELPDDANPWNTPLILSSILQRGSRTVNAYWSRIWVQQRIVPSDRQNIGQILKENGLDTYDEFELLVRADGRCAQDSYYIVEISLDDLPEYFDVRFDRKVEDVVALAGRRLLVFMRCGEVRLCDLTQFLASHEAFAPLASNEDYFRNVRIQVGGYGVSWSETLTISDRELYEIGIPIPVTQDDFVQYIQQRVITTAEAADDLQCSKQNIEDLVRRGKLHPIKESPKVKLFLKSEIGQRLWK